jgi:hypothetical protein
MLDMNGKRMLANNAEDEASKINVGSFNKGLYLLHIREKGKIVKTFKVSIE